MIKYIVFIFLIYTQCLSIKLEARTIKNSLDKLRDPFKRTLQIQLKGKKKERFLKTSFSNRLDLRTVQLDELKIIGVFLGKDRRAVGKKVSKGGKDEEEAFILKEGMKIGPEGIEVKAILPGGVVLLEKSLNIYDEIEYLETIIPVSGS